MHLYLIASFLVWGCASSSPKTNLANPTIELSINPDPKLGRIPPEKWKQFFRPIISWEGFTEAEERLKANVYQRSQSGWLTRGRDEILLGKFEAAERSLKEGVLQNDDHSELLLELAMLAILKKNNLEASRYLAEIKESMDEVAPKGQTPLLFKVQYVLALVLLEKGSLDNGRKILRELLSWDQTFAYGYTALSDSYRNTGEMKLAQFILQKGLERAGEDPAILCALGRIAEENKQDEEAATWYERAVAKNSDFPEASIGRARVWLRQGRYDLAQGLLHKVLLLRPFHTTGLTLLGAAYEKSGRIDEARAHYEKALGFDYDNVEARFLLANLLAQQGKNRDRAIHLFHEVKEMESADLAQKERAEAMILSLQGQAPKSI